MLPVRLSALSALGKRFIRTSAAQFQQEKIFRSTRERPLLSEYKAKGKVVRVERGVPEDHALLCDFMSEVCANQEPTSLSTGATAADFRPFVEIIATDSLNDVSYTMMIMEGDRLVGAGIGNHVKLDPKEAVEPRVREDYGQVIDDLKELIPSHAMRQVVAPAKDLCNMTIHFMPEGVRDIMRYDLAAVQKSSVGANIVLKMIYELALMGLASGIQYGDAQTTARATHRVHTKTGSKDVFHIPYEKMLDNGKRIHKTVPLADGSPALNLFIIDLNNIAKTAKC